VSVYWEEDGKLLAIGSLRAEGQAKDDWKPEERAFSSEDELLEFKKEELSLVAGKNAGNVFLRETKDKGIFLQAKKDVIMTSDGDITLKSKSGKTEVQSGGTLLLKNGDSSIEVSRGKIKTGKLVTTGIVPGLGVGDGSPAAIAPGSVNNRSATIKAEHGAKDRKRIKGGGNSTDDNKRISRAG